MYRVHPNHEKYPTLAKVLLNQYKVIGPQGLDENGNGLPLETALELLIKSKAYAPWADTLTADQLEQEIKLFRAPNEGVERAVARVRALAGHPDNLWIGPNYKRGESPLIVLHCTYWKGTYQCLQQFIDGRIDDYTFLILICGIISRGFLSKRKDIQRTGLEAMNKLALVNFVDRILLDNPTKPIAADYTASTPLFAARLQSLKPKVVLSLGSDHESYVTEATKAAGIPLVECIHPAARKPPSWYERMDAIAAKWNEVKAKCPYLARTRTRGHPARRIRLCRARL
jgi:hypothetical protein